MRPYKKIYNEELESGFIRSTYSDAKYNVFKIENLKELKDLPGNPRGVIAKNNLYICNDKGMNITHDNLLNYLKKQHIIFNIRFWWNKIESMQDFLCVHWNRDRMYIAESYMFNFFIGVKKNKELKLSLDNHLQVLKRLHIPFDIK
jgi:hypothetical protein